MKKLSIIIACVLSFAAYGQQSFAAENVSDFYQQGLAYHFRYLQKNTKEDFYKAQKAYEQALNEDIKNREAFEKLIELLLKKPVGWGINTAFYRSAEADRLMMHEVERNYRYRKGSYRRYETNGYRFVDNPLYEIDVLVNRAYNRFPNNRIKYDKKWLAKQYLQVTKNILAQNPSNPSVLMDTAYTLAERAYDLDKTNWEIIQTRNTFRKR